jgi:hypothetical protein
MSTKYQESHNNGVTGLNNWVTNAPAVQGLLVLHGQGQEYFTGANRQDAIANFTVLRIVSSCSFNYIEKIRFGLDPKIQRSRFKVQQTSWTFAYVFWNLFLA